MWISGQGMIILKHIYIKQVTFERDLPNICQIFHPNQWRIQGAPPARAPPYRSRFFRFDIQIFRNIAASGVGVPPYEVGAPPTGNPGSATANLHTIALTMVSIRINLLCAAGPTK